MAHPGVREFLWTHIGGGRGEGFRQSIYVDRVGLPTVGVGNYLRTASQVRQLQWFRAGDGGLADVNAVIQAWRPYAPDENGEPSAAGVAAAAGVGGQTVVPQFVTTLDSVHNVFISMFNFCESKAVEAMTMQNWMRSPADAQFAVFLHLWRRPNELHEARYAPFRDALVRRDWWAAYRLIATHNFRPPRLMDMQDAFRNAAGLEQARAELGNSVDVTILCFPGYYLGMSHDRWQGMPAAAGT